MRAPELANPTVVVITDSTELDGQLFSGFAISLLLPEKPQQIRRRAQLRDELANRTTEGIYFTTLQKFGLSRDERDSGLAHPQLSNRRNIVVIVDEAHRSHYDDLDGYARHLKDALPHATLIAFTGTPISHADRDTREELFTHLVDEIRTALAGVNWRAQLKPGQLGSFDKVALATTNHLRNPTTPGNKVDDGEETLADRFRRLTRQLTTAWALCSASEVLTPYRTEVQFYELVRIYMAKYDADARRAAGQPVPEDISRLLAALIGESTVTGEVLDIYAAAGIDKPELSELNPAYLAKAQQASNPHLAIEALRQHVLDESRRATGNNIARERLFSERVTELMNRYANEQLTGAQVIAELIEMAKEIRAEAARGARFTPPLDDDQLAFYDAVAQIARDLVAVMRRDVRTDWTVRDDVRAKLRSSIKRLLVHHGYPPDQQPAAIKLVIEQMEQLAPRYADRNG